MRIQLNGKTQELPAPADVAGLIRQFCNNKKNVIAEINGDIIPASQWPHRQIADGDFVELISFVGGG